MAYNRRDFLTKIGIAGTSVIGLKPFLKANHKTIIKPPPLSRGATIGMVSPASSLSSLKKYEKVAHHVEELGFKVKVGPHAKDHFGYFAGTDKERANDLNAMFADPEVDGIIPFRGGWGSNRILEYLDYAMIRDNPKPLIGFSDITSLLLAIYENSGLVTYHGPVGKSSWTDFTVSYFKKAVMQTQPFVMKSGHRDSETEMDPIYTIHPGKTRGKLLGGNLSVLTSMIGSSYLPQWEGSILFIEDVGEDVYRIDRMITQMKLNGILEEINGFIFGQCTHCPEGSGYHFTLEQILKNHLKGLSIPAFAGANIGHIANMFTLPIGIQAEINADIGTITLLESPTDTNV